MWKKLHKGVVVVAIMHSSERIWSCILLHNYSKQFAIQVLYALMNQGTKTLNYRHQQLFKHVNDNVPSNVSITEKLLLHKPATIVLVNF